VAYYVAMSVSVPSSLRPLRKEGLNE
jgi:hypothetical protein